SESALAERIGPIELEIAPLTLAYLPSVDGVDLRVTAWGLEPTDAEARLGVVVERLTAAVGEHTYGEDDADLAAVLLEALRRQRHRLGVAESCTGGMIGERITNVPGASDTFIGAGGTGPAPPTARGNLDAHAHRTGRHALGLRHVRAGHAARRGAGPAWLVRSRRPVARRR